MADETTAPLSDAEIAAIRQLLNDGHEADASLVEPLLATLAARDVEIERLKSQVTIHETWRQDAEFRLISEHEHHMREYDFAVDDPSAFEDGRLRLRIAALKRENAAYREIVAAVAGYDATYCGIEIGHECALNAQQRARTGGQDFGCHWNKFEDDRTRHMFVHGENCPVTRARALLGTPPEQQPTD